MALNDYKYAINSNFSISHLLSIFVYETTESKEYF
jgi:hypothetical protein